MSRIKHNPLAGRHRGTVETRQRPCQYGYLSAVTGLTPIRRASLPARGGLLTQVPVEEPGGDLIPGLRLWEIRIGHEAVVEPLEYEELRRHAHFEQLPVAVGRGAHREIPCSREKKRRREFSESLLVQGGIDDELVHVDAGVVVLGIGTGDGSATNGRRSYNGASGGHGDVAD